MKPFIIIGGRNLLYKSSFIGFIKQVFVEKTINDKNIILFSCLLLRWKQQKSGQQRIPGARRTRNVSNIALLILLI